MAEDNIPIEDGNDIPNIPTPHEFEIGFHNAIEMKTVNDTLITASMLISVVKNLLYIIIKTHPGRITEFEHWLISATEAGTQLEHILADIQAVATACTDATPDWFTDMVDYEYKQRIDPDELSDD